MKTLADTIQKSLSAFAEEFSPGYHPWALERDADYKAWWDELDESSRDAFEAQLAEHARQQEAKHRAALEEAASKIGHRRFRQLEEIGISRKDVRRIMDGDLVETQAMAAVREFLDSEKTLLVLSGTRGCGKTTSASWGLGFSHFHWVADPDFTPIREAESQGEMTWLEQLPSHRKSEVGFMDVSRLARLSRYSDEEMTKVESSSFLVIDDLGMEFADAKGSFLATLDGVINTRYRQELRTIITTNLPAAQFKSRYGERVADRIRESGRFVELGDKSMRGE